MIRPERVGVEPADTPGDNRLPGLVERAVYVGPTHELHVRVIGGSLLKATIPNDGSALRAPRGRGRDAAPAARRRTRARGVAGGMSAPAAAPSSLRDAGDPKWL